MTEFPHGFLLPENYPEFQAGDPDGMTSEIDGRKLMACMAGRVDELIPKMAIFERSHPFPKHQNIILDIYVTFSSATPRQSNCSLHQHFHTQQPYSSRQGRPC